METLLASPLPELVGGALGALAMVWFLERRN